MRRVVAALWLLLPATAAVAQNRGPAPAGLAFEVASVKENTSGRVDSKISGAGAGLYTVDNSPLKFLLHFAFDVRDHQVVNLPDWASDVPFDITARQPADVPPTIDNTRAMVRTLLAERFGLMTHRETREQPIYALVLARRDGRAGPGLVRSDVDCARWFAEKRPQINAGSPSALAPGGRRHACMIVATRRLVYGGTQTLPQLATVLQSLVGRPVLDRTGLAGTFDIDLTWDAAPAGASPGGGPSPEDVAAIFTAVQDQLGLKLEPSRAPFDVIVVDAVRRPTPD